MVIKKKKKVLHLCPEKFRMFTQMWSVSVGKFVLEMIFFAVVINVFDVVTSLYTNHHDRSPSLVRHTYHCPIITVIHCADWSANPDVKNDFLFISVVVYVDAATAWSNDSPVFLFFSFFFFSTNGSCPSLYFFSSPFYPTYLFLPFLFCWFVCFLTTASWNRSGWHPRSLTGQCTSHLPLPLLSFSDSRPLFSLPLLPYRLLFWLSFNTECNFIAPSVRSLTSSHLISPLHIPVFPLLYQLFTHSVFFPLHPLIFLSNNHLV